MSQKTSQIVLYFASSVYAGFLGGLTMYATSDGSGKDAIHFGCLSFGFSLALCWGFHSSQKYRVKRELPSIRRSPWGEKRVESPSPYSDRLADFLSNGVASSNDETQHASDHASTMPFWSVIELPTEPTAPKPPWFVRRILMRIREALTTQR